MKGRFIRAFAVILALAVWQAAAIIIGNRLLLVGPFQTAQKLFSMLCSAAFWRAAASSAAKIALSFLLACVAALILAVVSARFPVAEALLRPYIVTIQTVPVASFIVIALLWLSSKRLSVFISFVMVLPVMYQNLLQGIRSADPSLIEMAQLFEMPPIKRIRCIYAPCIEPYLLSASRSALGMCWKAGIAAEVIAVASGSIGGRLYDAKVSLDIPELFAWTAVTVALSVGFEKLFLGLFRVIFKRLEDV